MVTNPKDIYSVTHTRFILQLCAGAKCIGSQVFRFTWV